jgi:hypothetical protein
MKRIGLLGGMSSESSIEYYRLANVPPISTPILRLTVAPPWLATAVASRCSVWDRQPPMFA